MEVGNTVQSDLTAEKAEINEKKQAIRQKEILASTSLGFTLDHMDATFLSFALAPMIVDLNITQGQAGLISTMSHWGALLGGLLFGILADRIGRVKVLSHTIFLVAFATVGLYFAHDLNLVYLLRFMVGLGTGGEYGISMALLSECFSHEKMGRASSVCSIGGQVGSILAAVLASLIIPYFGWRALFLVGILPVAIAFFIRRRIDESDNFIQMKKAYASGKKRFSLKEMVNTPKNAYRSLGLTIMVMIQVSGYYGLMSWLPTIMKNKLGIKSTLSAGFVDLGMVPIIIGMALGMYVFGSILDKIGPKKAFSIFLIMSSLLVYTFNFASNLLSMTLLGALIGFFSNGMYGGYGAVISRIYPDEIRASANNTLMGVGRAIGGCSSIVIGLIMQYYNLAAVMLFLSVSYVISFVIMLTIPGLKNR